MKYILRIKQNNGKVFYFEFTSCRALIEFLKTDIVITNSTSFKIYIIKMEDKEIKGLIQ